MRKCVFTLNIGDYNPAICAITYPLIQAFAEKCDADFRIMTERKFPEWPITFEKLQLYELSKDYDWTYYIDSDALIHPDQMDPVNHLTPDTVCQYMHDMASHRFKYDSYFRRDNRHIGSCNWFAVASNDCRDLWHYPDDLDPITAIGNIYPIQSELRNNISRDHLIDDYVLSYNIARYGLKYKSVSTILKDLGYEKGGFIAHFYAMPEEKKIAEFRRILTSTNLWNMKSYWDSVVGGSIPGVDKQAELASLSVN